MDETNSGLGRTALDTMSGLKPERDADARNKVEQMRATFLRIIGLADVSPTSETLEGRAILAITSEALNALAAMDEIKNGNPPTSERIIDDLLREKIHAIPRDLTEDELTEVAYNVNRKLSGQNIPAWAVKVAVEYARHVAGERARKLINDALSAESNDRTPNNG